MKKVLVFLLACLSSAVMFGQQTGDYFQHIVAPNSTGNNMFINCVIFIDGVEQANMQLEIGVFDVATGECRGAKFPPRRLPNQRVYYALPCWGQSGETYTYRLYDHENSIELEYDVDFSNPDYPQLSYVDGDTHGGLRAPWQVYFVTPAGGGIDKEIVGYTAEGENWYILSSPVGTVPASSVTNLVTDEFAEGTFDLYGFDQNADDGYEWRNYWANDNFQLVAGKGYLYANAAPLTTITFHGEAYDGEGTFDLDYVEGTDWAGYNLMGNPYNANATVDVENFYVMEGEDFVAFEGEYIEPMQGVLILAEAAGTVTFTPNGEGSKTSKLSLNLTSGQHLVDRAIVSFGGNALPKFRINSNSTKLYIPMEDKDYAVVSCEPMGDIPVSFKASKSGSYTLSVNTHEVSFGYLHLIDNKTGMDVDLLATPSYSFDAQTTDYANRFRLVFATGNGSEDNFAFYSNGNLIINNEGEAMLQVVDVTGRILSSETISGCASVNVEGAAGVYMIRLINGENAKVQKVVVR